MPAEALDQGFQALYREHFGYVYNSLVRLGAGSDGEDLCHEVFLVAYRKQSSFDRTRPVKPWLFGIAHRVAADFRKRAHTRREVYEEPPEVASEGASAEAKLIEKERRRAVLDALGELDLDRRAVVVMCDLEGHSMPEVSEALGVPLNTAYTRLRTGRQEFAAAIRRRAMIRGEA